MITLHLSDNDCVTYKDVLQSIPVSDRAWDSLRTHLNTIVQAIYILKGEPNQKVIRDTDSEEEEEDDSNGVESS